MSDIPLDEERLERLGVAVASALGLHAALFVAVAIFAWGPGVSRAAATPLPPPVTDLRDPGMAEAERPPLTPIDPEKDAINGPVDSKGVPVESEELPEESNPFAIQDPALFEPGWKFDLGGGDEGAVGGGGDPSATGGPLEDALMRIDRTFDANGPRVRPGTSENAHGVLGPKGPGGRPGRKRTAPPEMVRGTRRALEWLARHQGADGRWSADRFCARCKGIPCGGSGDPKWDVGLTGLSLAAFLADGWTHQGKDGENPHRDTVRRGVDFLLRSQGADGGIGDGRIEEAMYNHALAACALAEAYAMTGDPALKVPVERAVREMLAARNPGAAWRYRNYNRPGSEIPEYGANDTSVTGWVVMALHAAEEAMELHPLAIPAVDIRKAYDGANAWLDSVSVPGPGGQEAYAYCFDGGKPKFITGRDGKTRQIHVTTGAGALIRQFTGNSGRAAAAVRTLAAHLPAMGPGAGTPNFYEWYYTTLALYQHGGEPWDACREAIKGTIYRNLRGPGDGCLEGSFDPVDEWGHAGGRVYATACAALCMESHWRYIRQEKKMDTDKE